MFRLKLVMSLGKRKLTKSSGGSLLHGKACAALFTNRVRSSREASIAVRYALSLVASLLSYKTNASTWMSQWSVVVVCCLLHSTGSAGDNHQSIAYAIPEYIEQVNRQVADGKHGDDSDQHLSDISTRCHLATYISDSVSSRFAC